MQISSIGKKQEPEKSNLRKYILIALIACVILLVIVLICMVLIKSNIKETKTLELTIDGEVKQGFKEETFMFDDEGNIYISLKDIAGYIGYAHTNGDDYKGNTEDKQKCSMICDNEKSVYEYNSNKIYKSIEDGTNTYSEFVIDSPVKKVNDKLYVIPRGLEVGCNLKFTYNPNENKINIITLPALYKEYNEKAMAGEYGENVESVDEEFSNKKSILYNMLVIKGTVKGETKYGVISLDGETCLSTKYDEIIFVENTQDFFVKGNKKYGLLSKEGKQKIALEYDEIKLLDNKTSLYYVSYNGKKGVLDKFGKARIYADFDEIGIDTSHFPTCDIKNPMLLFDNCIPVRLGNKWGIYDITGKRISNFNWDNIGYVESTESGRNQNNVLIVECGKITGLVVCRERKYGIINSIGKVIVPCIYDRIYSETSEGEEKYYLEFGEDTKELESILKDRGININQPNDDNDNNDYDVVDLDKTPTPNLDLETPHVIQDNPTTEPTPVEEYEESSEVEDTEYEEEIL